MQTYLRDEPDMASLMVGDPLAIDLERMCGEGYSGYLTVMVPKQSEPIHILQTWECPYCDSPTNWAEVIVNNGLIESIDAVKFDREHFEKSALISNDAISIAADLTGKPFNELVSMDIIQLLRDKL
ncbi:MAG TPA: hypothetical protein VK249_26265 [Anaerolineales bacterium]|nr:hypothetical protein [Anaerolineales bacterium]